MYEKVNPCHPDKVADRIAGAVVDYAYTLNDNPKVAVEVLIGHRKALVIVETSENLQESVISDAVLRIADIDNAEIIIVPQDKHLSANQSLGVRCGDNGIFKGVPMTFEQKKLSKIAREIYAEYRCDGKYIKDDEKLIICQSNAFTKELKKELQKEYPGVIVNPLGDWTGGSDVDSGATNRKLGSDMGDSVTGGGLHGKDLSQADVSVNIYLFLKAQESGRIVQACCAIGDDTIDGKPYSEIIDVARDYIKSVGGFEKFAEWGLI